MQQFSYIRKQSLARVFALVALLCAGALQAQEASHNHWNSLDDSYAQCLVCKSGSAALPASLPVEKIQPAGVPAGTEAPVTLVAEPPVSFLARGPPTLS